LIDYNQFFVEQGGFRIMALKLVHWSLSVKVCHCTVDYTLPFVEKLQKFSQHVILPNICNEIVIEECHFS